MSVYKPGKQPECMIREGAPLGREEVAKTVASLSYEGLQLAAAFGLTLAARNGISPAYINETLCEMSLADHATCEASA